MQGNFVVALWAATAATAAALDKGTYKGTDNLFVMEAENAFPEGSKVGATVGNCAANGCWKIDNTHKGYDGSTYRGAGYIVW
jgi:hypothetical protein